MTQLRGIPEISESETFLTDDCRSNSFCLRRDICLEVVHIDTVKSIVSTKQPLQMPGSHEACLRFRFLIFVLRLEAFFLPSSLFVVVLSSAGIGNHPGRRSDPQGV